ncbi:AAA family ATPase [Thalassococcus sp. BH17M4-6]|uniref:AAA family ATPase n=1 Tax=Thalassococcus sp. BH17M4-6 TaxID=3413148 RepID=UPI003BC509EC
MLAGLGAWRSGCLNRSEVSSSLCLSGPPDTGKTLLASALAGSADIPLAPTSYAECQCHGHQGDALRALHDASSGRNASASRPTADRRPIQGVSTLRPRDGSLSLSENRLTEGADP